MACHFLFVAVLLEKVLAFVTQWHLLTSGEVVVAAVSGGPDSVCMLHILSRLALMLNFKLHVAHLNHGLRGEESDADAEYVRQLAHQLGLPVTIERRDIEAFRTSERLSLEEAARVVRYTFLAEIADSIGASKIAVGHTSDDQVETILLHFVRGTGLTGLRGMAPTTNRRVFPTGPTVNVIRPLLEVSRAETEQYCVSHNLAPRYDISNLSLSFARNRIRLELLPQMRTINSHVDQSILRLSHVVTEDLALLESTAEDLFQKSVEKENNTISLNKESILAAPPALQRHLIRLVLRRLLGDLVDIEMVNVEAILGSLQKPAGTSLTLPRGLTFHIGYNEYVFSPSHELEMPYPEITGTYLVNIPGETEIKGWRVRTRIEKPGECQRYQSELPWIAHFDRDRVGNRVLVRRREIGDRFQPLGMASLKKLQDFMVDEKIPRRWRDTIPILANEKQILWIVGFRIDERVKVTDGTSEVLHVEFEPEVTTRT